MRSEEQRPKPAFLHLQSSIFRPLPVPGFLDPLSSILTLPSSLLHPHSSFLRLPSAFLHPQSSILSPFLHSLLTPVRLGLQSAHVRP